MDMCLGKGTAHAKNGYSAIHTLATRGLFVKTQKMQFLLNRLSDFHGIWNEGAFRHNTRHILRVLDLTYFLGSERSKFEISASKWHVSLLFGAGFCYLVWWCIKVPCTCTPNFDSPFGLQGAKRENAKCAITPKPFNRFSQNLNCRVNLAIIPKILSAFWIWPAIQGHRGQNAKIELRPLLLWNKVQI